MYMCTTNCFNCMLIDKIYYFNIRQIVHPNQGYHAILQSKCSFQHSQYSTLLMCC